jgi:hypothetical protein
MSLAMVVVAALVMATAASAQASKLIYDNYCQGSGFSTFPSADSTAGGRCFPTRGSAVNASGAGAAAPGDVYVVDGGNHRIQQLTARGKFVRAWGWDVVAAGRPNDQGTSAFEVCDTTTEPANVASDCKAGTTTPSTGNGGQLNNPQGVAVNQVTGDVYVTESGNRRTSVFSAEGEFQRTFGWDVTVGGDTAFEICTVANECKQAAAAGAGAGQFAAMVGYPAINPVNEHVLVADPSNRRVQEFESDGSFVRLFGWDVVGVNEQQRVTIGATGGSYKLAFEGEETAAIDFNATGAQVAAALAALPAIGSGNIAGSGSATLPKVLTFQGTLAGTDVNELTVADNSLTGGAASVTVETLQDGAGGNFAGFEICSDAALCKVGAASGSDVGRFSNNQPRRVAVNSAGVIYTVEAGDGNFRVQTFTPDGATLTPAIFNPPLSTDPPFSLTGSTVDNTPSDIAIGSDDSIFVVKPCDEANCPEIADPSNANERRIYELSPEGALLDVHLAGAGVTTTVEGLSVNPVNDDLYLSELERVGFTFNSRIALIVDPPDAPPVVATGQASAGSADHLRTLEGTANPGGFRLDQCRFVYGTTTAYGQSVPCTQSIDAIGDGTDDVAVSAETEPLEPGTTYHYRLVASNVTHTGQGEDRTFTTGPAPADTCPNADRRAEQGIGTLLLPSCMALEQVSPRRKHNQRTLSPHVSAGGDRVRYLSQAAIGDNPINQGVIGDPVVSTRGGTGWASANVNPPSPYLYFQANPMSFTPEFDRWSILGAATAKQVSLGIAQNYRGGLGRPFEPVSPLFTRRNWDSSIDSVLAKEGLMGVSADQSHLYFDTPSTSSNRGIFYLDDDPKPVGSSADANLYVSHLDASGNSSLELVARDSDGKVWGGNCGARMGGVHQNAASFYLPNGLRNQGAISPDGSRVYFSTRAAQAPPPAACDGDAKMRIFERTESQSGPDVSELIESECGREVPDPPCAGHDGDDVYQGASVDRDLVYFTTNRQLADTDVDGSAASCSNSSNVAGCDLYLLDRTKPQGQQLLQVSAGDETAATPGAGANVRNSITAISGDGSHVYFVARSVLTTKQGPAGDSAQPNQNNLYLYKHPEGEYEFIGALGAVDAGTIWGGEANWRNGAYAVPIKGTDGEGEEIGGAGDILLFMSSTPLTSDDDDSAADIFRYDAKTAELERISSAAPGGADDGAFDVSAGGSGGGLGADYAEEDRWVDEAGETVVFRTSEALLPGDRNGLADGYMWRADKLHRLPGSMPSQNLAPPPPTISHDGSTVAYQSGQPLLPSDGDSAVDIYVARVHGGFPPPAHDAGCDTLAGGCQGDGADALSTDTQTSSSSETGNAPVGNRKRLRVGNISRKARRRAARRGVLRVRVRTSRAGLVRVLARAKIGKRTRRVAGRKVRVRKAGAVTVKLRLSRAAKRRLRSGRALRVRLRVASPGARTRTTTVRLKRGKRS